jgi:lipid II:glycine glycyltransferase (peptidoglycan interpeptide bridge formation enzyme)
MTALANHAKTDFKAIYCQLVPEVVDISPFTSAGYHTQVYYTYRIDLTDVDQVWREMEDKRRNDIRRAERDGITVDDSVTIKDVLSLAEKTYQRQEKKVHFSDLATRVEGALLPEGRCRCFVARSRDGTPLAGIFTVWDDKDAYYFLGGYNPEGHRGAGALAIWQGIRYAAVNLGLKRFDFLGSHLTQLERFFRDFGGVWTPTYHVSWERPSLRRDVRRVFGRLGKMIRKCIGAKSPTSPVGEPASL